ncbi:MAG: acyl-CoA dehydrogenase family protein [Deltaproteobacteria bacterium]|nr:acyl-CoA dehydrogenase family protein [Deltaproteobacteria bacterium]
MDSDPEQIARVARVAREFALAEFPAVARECDRSERYPREIWEKAGRLGLMGIFLPEEFGGLGLGILPHARVMEEFWRVDPGVGNVLLAVFGAEILAAFGTEEQKRRYLPDIAQGRKIWGCAITEPDAGSDIFSQTTTARREGASYVLNGSKQFSSNGTVADHLLVMCRTNPEEPDRLRRYSFLVVDRGMEGLSTVKLTGKLGIRASDTASVYLDEVVVPEENLVGGAEGRGFRQVMHLFNINRVVAAAQGVGVAQGALDRALAYTKERVQFGRPVASFQGVQFLLAEMFTRIEAARHLYRMVAQQIDEGRFDPKLVSAAKLLAGETGTWVTAQAVELLGGSGCFADADVERLYRDAKIVEIYEGAREIEKATIAAELLGRGFKR